MTVLRKWIMGSPMQIKQEEKPTSGLTFQIFDNGIHRFHITKMTRDTVDAIVERAMQIDKIFHENEGHACFLYILDDVPFTPYLLQKVIQAVQTTPADLCESTAVVAKNFTLGIFRSLIVPRVSAKARQSTQFFTDEQEAREWLVARIAALANAE